MYISINLAARVVLLLISRLFVKAHRTTLELGRVLYSWNMCLLKSRRWTKPWQSLHPNDSNCRTIPVYQHDLHRNHTKKNAVTNCEATQLRKHAGGWLPLKSPSVALSWYSSESNVQKKTKLSVLEWKKFLLSWNGEEREEKSQLITNLIFDLWVFCFNAFLYFDIGHG